MVALFRCLAVVALTARVLATKDKTLAITHGNSAALKTVGDNTDDKTLVDDEISMLQDDEGLIAMKDRVEEDVHAFEPFHAMSREGELEPLPNSVEPDIDRPPRSPYIDGTLPSLEGKWAERLPNPFEGIWMPRDAKVWHPRPKKIDAPGLRKLYNVKELYQEFAALDANDVRARERIRKIIEDPCEQGETIMRGGELGINENWDDVFCLPINATEFVALDLFKNALTAQTIQPLNDNWALTLDTAKGNSYRDILALIDMRQSDYESINYGLLGMCVRNCMQGRGTAMSEAQHRPYMLGRLVNIKVFWLCSAEGGWRGWFKGGVMQCIAKRCPKEDEWVVMEWLMQNCGLEYLEYRLVKGGLDGKGQPENAHLKWREDRMDDLNWARSHPAAPGNSPEYEKDPFAKEGFKLDGLPGRLHAALLGEEYVEPKGKKPRPHPWMRDGLAVADVART